MLQILQSPAPVTPAALDGTFRGMTALTDGGYALVWDTNTGETAQGDVLVRIYNADGAARGGSVTLADTNSGKPEVMQLAGGEIVVVYERTVPDGTTYHMQRIGADATAQGAPVLLQTSDVAVSGGASVSPRPDGGFTMSFEDLDADRIGLFARRFEADGTPMGAAVPVNTVTDGLQTLADLEVLPDGGHAVIWTTGEPSDDPDVALRLFGADGAARTAETIAASQSADNQVLAQLGVLDGGRIASRCGSRFGEAAGTDRAVIRLFDTDGTPLTDDFYTVTDGIDVSDLPAVTARRATAVLP